MLIQLLRDVGSFKKGEILEVLEVVPHGGYSDSACQYVIGKDTRVISDNAKEIK